MPAKKKNTAAVENTTAVQEEVPPQIDPTSDYVQMYQQVMQDGKNYMLGISKIDHHWYKQAEISRFQRDDRNNLPFNYEFDKPVILTKADIKFLDGGITTSSKKKK